MFSHFSDFEVQYLPECLMFNVPDKYHYLSPKHLNVTSSSLVPNFCNFSENRLLLDSNFKPTFTLLPSCKQMLQPFKHNVVWAFLAKRRRHQTLLYSDFFEKIEYLRRHFNRITISYKYGKWLSRFGSLNSVK